MKPALPINAVRVTTQGRIVMPRHLRKKHPIEAGAQAMALEI